MESQPRNTEFRTNPENFHPCTLPRRCICADISKPLLGTYAIGTKMTWPPPPPPHLPSSHMAKSTIRFLGNSAFINLGFTVLS